MSCIAFLGDSPETQSSWQRGDVLRRVYLTMLEEDVHIIAGSDKWEHVTARSGGARSSAQCRVYAIAMADMWAQVRERVLSVHLSVYGPYG